VHASRAGSNTSLALECNSGSALLSLQVLQSWDSADSLPHVIADADDRAEAASQLARDLLLRLHTNDGPDGGRGQSPGATPPQLKLAGVSAAQLARLAVTVVSEASPLCGQPCSICLTDVRAGDRLRCMPVRTPSLPPSFAALAGSR